MKTKLTGFRCITRKRSSGNYVGGIVAFEEGRKLWTNMNTILRLSRDDAMHDARMMAQCALRSGEVAIGNKRIAA